MVNKVAEGVAPPGWEKSIKKMKRAGDVDNPWALSWWLRKRGAKPHREDTEEDAGFDAEVRAALHLLAQQSMPPEFAAAARGETWAHVLLLQASAMPLLVERR